MGSIPFLDDLVREVEAGNGGAPLDRLGAAAELAERVRHVADELVDHFVHQARAAGCSWEDVGRAFGVTRQAAQQRFVGVAAAAEHPALPGFDEPSQAVLGAAAREARRLGHHYIAPEHLILGLFAQPEELAARALAALGVSIDVVRTGAAERLGSAAPRPGGSLGMAPQTKRLLGLARTLAKRLGHRCARTEHLLLAAVSPVLDSPGAASLVASGADATTVCEQLASMLEVEAPELAAKLRRPRNLRRGLRSAGG